MKMYSTKRISRGFLLLIVLTAATVLLMLLMWGLSTSIPSARAAPIPPPDGYPKFLLSSKTVTPTLTGVGGSTLFYEIEVVNTGAYTAENTMVSDLIPAGTTYNNDAVASSGPPPTFTEGLLEWAGTVGFDSSVLISFSVDVSTTFTGTIQNTAVISQALISEPVTVSAETAVTDQPVFNIDKSSSPDLPGANKPLTYTLRVVNNGQPAAGLPLTVVDHVPLSTTLRSVGPDGIPSPNGSVVTWTRVVDLDFGETTTFTFSVDVDDVLSGTVITNETYSVDSPESELAAGQPYTATVVDPIFSLAKQTNPDPVGSNRAMTYTLTLLNEGSLATGIVITDRVPASVTYVTGGSYSDGVVSWQLDSLNTGESADFSFTVFIGDVAGFSLDNSDYGACSAEGVCVTGTPLSSMITPPIFEATAYLDPIAKKPGGGGGPVTPTLVVKNLGPGNAINATALLKFRRISVQASDLYAIPAIGTSPPFPDGPPCGSQCVTYIWQGSLAAGETVTFTTLTGQNSIIGSEGSLYTATVAVSDDLGAYTTQPVTGTASGKVTHLANLIPTKSAPAKIGAGQVMTYSFNIWNSALTTDLPPSPWLTDTVPVSVTVLSISDGGVQQVITDHTVVSWTLPSLGPGDSINRYYTVQVNEDVLSGTQIVNDDYRTTWYESEDNEFFHFSGEPVTTTVRAVGLVDSYKVVTPVTALPGEGIILTHTVHIVNTSPDQLNGVQVYDQSPWEHSTYQRDAVASSGQVISDIVSVEWTGNIAPFSSELLTFTVVVDPNYSGPITNTAVITHPDLQSPVTVQSVAYITDLPVLRISKTAAPDPVSPGGELLYTLFVQNLGQQATGLMVTDTIPAQTQYAAGSASAGGQLAGDEVRWTFPLLRAGEVRTLTFRVQVQGGPVITNSSYGVTSAEGVSDLGDPVMTRVRFGNRLFLPIVVR